MSRLRQKLGDDPEARYIKTVRGNGLRLYGLTTARNETQTLHLHQTLRHHRGDGAPHQPAIGAYFGSQSLQSRESFLKNLDAYADY